MRQRVGNIIRDSLIFGKIIALKCKIFYFNYSGFRRVAIRMLICITVFSMNLMTSAFVIQKYRINTIAGGPVGPVSGQALNILQCPSVVACRGNYIYLYDGNYHVINRVNIFTGQEDTFAGNGVFGYTGDGGNALEARIGSVNFIVFDSRGNMYFTDGYYNVLRKIDYDTNIITTLAGCGESGYSGDEGPAAGAKLNNPNGLCFDNNGDIYLADTYNNCIRKINHNNGLISKIIGSGVNGYSGDGSLAASAKLSWPSGIVIDRSNNIYISDTGNNRIRKVDSRTGFISTVAGNGIRHGPFAYSGPGSSISLDYPCAEAIDNGDNVYIIDKYNNCIRRMDPGTNFITTVVSDVHASGLAVDSALSIYSADGVCVYRTDINNSNKVIVAGCNGLPSGDSAEAKKAQMSRPRSICFDKSGNIYIADTSKNIIRKVDYSTGIITTIAGNGNDGYSGDDGPAADAKLSYPSGVAVFDTELYIADSNNSRIGKINLDTGMITTVAGKGVPGYSGDGSAAIDAKLNRPSNIALDNAGNLYIADIFNYRIRRVDRTTGIISTVAGNGIDGYSGDLGPAVSAKLCNPYDIAFDNSDNMYITQSYEGCIRKVDHVTGIIMTVAGNGNDGFSGDGGKAVDAQLNEPQGIDVDALGNLFVADTYNNRVRRVDQITGDITTVYGNGPVMVNGSVSNVVPEEDLSYATDVKVDSKGRIYIVDSGNSRIITAKGLLIGDVNQDEYVDSGDYELIKQLILGRIISLPGMEDNSAADIDGDGKITSRDCALLYKNLIK